MDITRITARWSGFSGAPGYSNFYFASGFLDGGLFGEEAELLAGRVADAFEALGTALPRNVSIDIEPEVATIDSDTGVAQTFTSIDPPNVGLTTGSDQPFAGPAGAVITWRTNDLRGGRRIRGRTFLVPLATTAYQEDGTLTPQALTAVRGFGDAMLGGTLEGDFGVWSRPRGGSGGVFASAVSYTVPDKVAVLRSRRD